MKTNYLKFSNTFRLSVVLISILFASTALMAESAVTKTIVFMDDFNRADITPGGVPELTYTVAFTDDGNTPLMDANRIKLLSKSSMNGDASVIGSLTGYASPFTAKLSECTSDSLVWTLNVRQNYNGTLSGFSKSGTVQNGVGIILCADSPDLTVANGYAIINGGEGPGIQRYSLVKFTDGLDDNANLGLLVAGQVVSSTNRAYMSIKVSFVPATNTWKLYEREDGTTDFIDPLDVSTIDYNFLGSTVDATFTSTLMSSFGYTINFKSMSSALQMLVDNYQVTTSKTDVGTGISSSTNVKPYNVHAITNGLNITTTNANVILYNTLGKKIIEKNVNGSFEFKNLNQGVYFVKVEMNNRIYSSKVIVR